MCTVLVRVVRHDSWPVVIAANRDEMATRPWKAPGRHWVDRPDVVAGLDILAGGSWLGMNDHGVVAALLNRVGTLGPQAGKRTRGELVLDALDFADARDAVESLSAIDAHAFRPFNMIVVDNRDAFWLRADGAAVSVCPIPEGIHMLTAHDLDDSASPRVTRYLPRFRVARSPDAGGGDWGDWAALVADGGAGEGEPDEERAAMCFTLSSGFGTVSSSLIALPAIGHDVAPVWRFAAGRPDRVPFEDVVR